MILIKLSPSHFIAARELHQNRTPHFHAYVELPSRRDIRHAGWMDYEGRHANIASVRNVQAAITYCKKDRLFLEYFIWEDEINPFNPYDCAKRLPGDRFYE